MTGDLTKDWLVYVMLAAMIGFFTYAIIKGNQGPKDDKKDQSKDA